MKYTTNNTKSRLVFSLAIVCLLQVFGFQSANAQTSLIANVDAYQSLRFNVQFDGRGYTTESGFKGVSVKLQHTFNDNHRLGFTGGVRRLPVKGGDVVLNDTMLITLNKAINQPFFGVGYTYVWKFNNVNFGLGAGLEYLDGSSVLDNPFKVLENNKFENYLVNLDGSNLTLSLNSVLEFHGANKNPFGISFNFYPSFMTYGLAEVQPTNNPTFDFADLKSIYFNIGLHWTLVSLK